MAKRNYKPSAIEKKIEELKEKLREFNGEVVRVVRQVEGVDKELYRGAVSTYCTDGKYMIFDNSTKSNQMLKIQDIASIRTGTDGKMSTIMLKR